MKTWLFVPAHNAHMLNKALNSHADVVIVDWEDAVPECEKPSARSTAREILTTVTSRPRLTLRINGVHTPYYAEDIAALQGLSVTGIMLPKVNGPEDLRELAKLGIPLFPTLESALSIENAFLIAKGHPLVERLILGAMDLIADIGAQWQPDGVAIQYARARILIASRAAGIKGPIDAVYPRLGDLEGLRAEATTALMLGYEGKLLIHPEQIDIVHEVFTPTSEDIERAKQTIAIFNEALITGRSAIRIDERFIDPPMILWARNILRRAGETGTLATPEKPECT